MEAVLHYVWAPGSPSGCPLPPEEVAKEEEELTSEGSDLMDAEGEGWSANVRCAMSKGIPSKGDTGSKKRLKTETTNDHWKNIYNQKRKLSIRYKESKAGS